jgi:hypothetical protein
MTDRHIFQKPWMAVSVALVSWLSVPAPPISSSETAGALGMVA